MTPRRQSLVALLVPLGACGIDVGYGGTSYRCEGGVCPAGQACVQGRCVRPGSVADAAPPDAIARVADGLVVYYPFDEGSGATVTDRSGVGVPLDLSIDDPDAVAWGVGVLAVAAPTLIRSPGPATKIVEACLVTSEITLEAWVRPANVTQGGPARLVTLSVDTSNRNFQLGQELDAYYQARLRTTLSTSANGSPFLATPEGAGDVRPELTHLVFTRDAAGQRRIYVDNVLRAADTFGGDFSTWETSWSMALANEHTFDRTWLGEYHLVAIYSRALSAEEVARNHAAGP